jgi:hypothetical protein
LSYPTDVGLFVSHNPAVIFKNSKDYCLLFKHEKVSFQWSVCSGQGVVSLVRLFKKGNSGTYITFIHLEYKSKSERTIGQKAYLQKSNPRGLMKVTIDGSF